MSVKNDLMLDVSQAAELKLAFRRNGWNNAEIKALSEGNILTDVLKVIKGQAEIKINGHLIDCDAAPLIRSDTCAVEEHKKNGVLRLDPEKISLYMSKKQKEGNINGYDLRKELTDKSVMNDNVRVYLLEHPELIPGEWEGKGIFFLGTIYRGFDGTLFVRGLRKISCGWHGVSRGLEENFDDKCFTALLN